jgi:hypothetical protein
MSINMNNSIVSTLLPLINPKNTDRIYIYDNIKSNIGQHINEYIKENTGDINISIHRFYSDDYMIDEGIYDIIICFPDLSYYQNNNTIDLINNMINHMNKNSCCAIILPDNFLLSTDNINMEMRQYLLDNFNIEKIYEIDTYTSLVFFTTNGYTTTIDFHELGSDENNYNTLSYNYLKDNNYMLFDDTDLPELLPCDYIDMPELIPCDNTINYDYICLGELCCIKPNEYYIIIDTTYDNSILSNTPNISILPEYEYKKNQLVLSIDMTRCSTQYLYFYLKQNIDKFIECFDKTTKNLIVSLFFDMKIPIPPPYIQNTYIDICKNLYDMIDTNNNMIDLYKKYKNSIISMYNINCKMLKLNNLATIQYGELLTPRTFIDGPYPVVGGGSKTPKRFHHEYNRDENTILCLNLGKNAGYVSLSDTKVWSSTSVAIIPNNSMIDNKYLFYYLQSIQDNIYKLQDNNGIPFISSEKLSNIYISVPSLEKQRLINSEISRLDKKINNIMNHNKLLKLENILDNMTML